MGQDWNSFFIGGPIPLFCLNPHKVVYLLHLDHLLLQTKKCSLQKVLGLIKDFQLDRL